jgi:eukaryotic-like serine/threonine-protein kinase
MSAVFSPSGARRVGRFELRRILGKGAQATVWLGHDARLDRDVAVKLLNRDADSVAVNQWLHEARAVSRLAHPHIVPVFEADEVDGQSYLVFEFVDGPTLSQALKTRGALPQHEAVQLMLGVLDALAAAHAQGIVHRDLKPSNILIGKDGRARVMDFGIAARVAGGGDGRIVGTPGYMSPEAARGEPPVPAMDVFSAAMVLGEMLAGAPLLRERDPHVAVRRVQEEDMLLPPGCQADDGLRAVATRALSRKADDRYDGAAAMHRALTDWRKPAVVAAEAGAGAGGGTLEFLLRRMRHKSDFPALSSSVMRIQRVASSEHENLNSLSQEVLKDVALTNKLLRMVNTAHFSQAGSGGVNTVSRAVALVGFAGIRNMALSLVLLERMHDKSHAQQLKEEFLRSLMAGHLAGELSHLARDAEEVFIGALFQNLGRLLTEFYFPEEAVQIRTLVKPAASRSANLAPAPDEAVASARVLGISFEELGIGVAKSWGLPDSLRHCMRKPAGEPPARPLERGAERQRWVAAAANEVADLLLACEPDEAAQRIGAIAERHAKALGTSPASLRAAAGKARERLVQMAEAMSIVLAPASPARRLLAPAAQDTAPAPEPDSLAGHGLHATRAAEPVDLDLVGDAPTLVVAQQRPREEVSQLLSAGIQDITNSMVADGFKLNEVLRMVLETMLRALHFQRVIFCLRDPKTEMLTGRFGLGERASEVAAVFKVPLKVAPGAKADLFTAVCLKAADTLITDASVPAIAGRLPPWHAEKAGAPAFLLLPMALKGAPFALIYADKAQPGAIELDEKELNLLRTLRNQAVMAFRQAG